LLKKEVLHEQLLISEKILAILIIRVAVAFYPHWLKFHLLSPFKKKFLSYLLL